MAVQGAIVGIIGALFVNQDRAYIADIGGRDQIKMGLRVLNEMNRLLREFTA